MTIVQMHEWFRQYAQQMGLQNVRAILPEQIDLLINTSISDTVNELIKTNIAVTNDRIVTDNSKLDTINTLRSLYSVLDITFTPSNGAALVPDASSSVGRWTCFPFMEDATVNGEPVTAVLKCLYLVDLAIDYRRVLNNVEKVTAYYPVRLIDDAYLADTMQDFALKPRVRTPIAVIYSNRLDIYLGEDYEKGNGILVNTTLAPNKLRVSYLRKPATVKFAYDLNPGESQDCDLPENLHVNILKHAVDLYNISISGSLHAAQQQQQRQNQEVARNNARPDNEGYQS